MVSKPSNLKKYGRDIYYIKVKKFTYENIKLIMQRPFKNREAFRKIKKSLISNYSEYISLNKTKENPQKLAYLITLISSIESKLITHLKSRRMKHIPPNYNNIRFKYPPRYYKYDLNE